MKAKCGNCQKEMEQEESPNWLIYCNDEPCVQAMKDSVLGKRKK